MKNPLYPSAKANVQVDQRDRWFAWMQGVGAFSSLLNQRHFMPMIGEQVVRNGLGMLRVNAAAGVMDGPVNAVRMSAANSYLQLPLTEPLISEIDCSYPVLAFWAKNTPLVPPVERWWVDRLSAGAPNISYGFGVSNANTLVVRLSTDGTNVTDLAPAVPASVSAWNFYAFQHKSATETNVLVNSTLTTYNTGYATIFTGGACDYRIGWKTRSYVALVALANDNSANCVQKLLGLYYHSRYAFRDDWT